MTPLDGLAPGESGDDPVVAGLCGFVDASPSPYHAVQATRVLLTAAGFRELSEAERWPTRGGRYLVARDGSLAAWSTEGIDGVGGPGGRIPDVRVIAAHTDSPNFRIKPQPDVARLGWDQLAVEVYGGALVNSWLDRDLGLSGRVALRDPGSPQGVAAQLWRDDTPLLRIPQLAIHLDRAIRADGLQLNPQTQLVPVWGATGSAPTFRDWLAASLDVDAADVLGWDLMTHDLTPARRIGRVGDLVAAPRLDNLASCYAAVRALVSYVASHDGRDGRDGYDHAQPRPRLPLVVLYDHEEIGSVTRAGAGGQFLTATWERIVCALGGDRQDVLASMACALVCSADMAHAVHPNYVERHDPEHLLRVGGGVALKVNVSGRYATDGVGAASARLAAARAGIGVQSFTSRGDMPCGSTIGPVTAARTGSTTLDVGAPMLSMHSARELAAVRDVADYVAFAAALLR
ncbi:MAG: M18 family aminopeptidase [Dermatophilaceae bacterium]